MTYQCYDHRSETILGRYYRTTYYFTGDYELIRTTDFFTQTFTDELKPNSLPLREFVLSVENYNRNLVMGNKNA